MSVNTNIPIRFEQVEDYDSRFQKVKIWLMHLGKNYNNSFFDMDAVVNAMATLKNTPILGYVEKSKFGSDDFRGHESELVVEDGEVKIHYLGQAYGVIPENCNPRFEQKTGDDGQLLDYLVVDGLIWTKFDEAKSILDESGEVNQSMELDDEYDGFWDEEGFFHFTNFKFYGACMLGKDVLPAMQKASVETVFSTDVIKSEIDKKLKEFYQIQNQSKEVTCMTLEELMSKYSVTVEGLAEKGIVAEDFSVEELEVKIQETFESTDVVEETQEEVVEEVVEDNASTENVEEEFENKEDVVEDNQDEVADKYRRTFELSHEDIRWRMYEQLDTHMNSKGLEGWYYISSVYESHIIVEEDNERFFKVDYAKDGDNINLGEAVEVFGMFLTSDEKGALELMRANFEKYEKENEELRSFQSGVVKAQHKAEAEVVFSNFTKLTEEDVKELKENIHNFTIEQVESKCYELLGRKTANFTKKDAPASIKMNFSNSEDQPIKTGTDSIFAKHGIIK